jgi:fatty-acyl-CoA synthase
MMARDISEPDRSAPAHSWRRALELTAPIAQNPDVTFPVVIDRLAREFGAAPALLSDRQTLSYAELAERARHYASWALAQGLAPGEVVCLIMPNCPEYLAVWLGIVQVGGVVALINTNLVGDGLRHAIDHRRRRARRRRRGDRAAPRSRAANLGAWRRCPWLVAGRRPILW